ncbi:MAG TPA: DNA polymerase ligase N-terminal domain-containing protein [Thermoanaerobaculia bacterium]
MATRVEERARPGAGRAARPRRNQRRRRRRGPARDPVERPGARVSPTRTRTSRSVKAGSARAASALETYRRKRRFGVTPEPRGKTGTRGPTGALAYVIQKHRATAVHHDFRLEWKGVMKSWAVPKGPSLDPAQKRLAMPTEDHPLEYNHFEGVIPEGEYGGGTVMIWDRGTWWPEVPDVDEALRRGELKFRLDGEKLKGSWVLVRIGKRGEKKPAWLLIKHKDAAASKRDITDTEPRSVVSGRLLVEIARDEGGDMARAADGDPPALLRRMLADPSLVKPPKKSRRKSVWHSDRSAS